MSNDWIDEFLSNALLSNEEEDVEDVEDEEDDETEFDSPPLVTNEEILGKIKYYTVKLSGSTSTFLLILRILVISSITWE